MRYIVFIIKTINKYNVITLFTERVRTPCNPWMTQRARRAEKTTRARRMCGNYVEVYAMVLNAIYHFSLFLGFT